MHNTKKKVYDIYIDSEVPLLFRVQRYVVRMLLTRQDVTLKIFPEFLQTQAEISFLDICEVTLHKFIVF
jgi:hypothetical protein